MTVNEVVAPVRPPRRRPRWASLVVVLLVAGIGLFVAIQLAGGFGDAIEALEVVDLRWLAAAIGCEAVSYVFLSWQLRYLAGHGADLTRRVRVS